MIASQKTKVKKSKLAEMSHFEEGYVTSFDGTQIWFKTTGEGIPMIFCNGLGCSTFYWQYMTPYFKKTHQIVLFDWRAHGKSQSPQDPQNMHIGALAEDLKHVMDHLKIKKAILVGHSMATQILYYFYAKYKQRVLALIPCFGTFGKLTETFYNLPIAKQIFELIFLFNHNFPSMANKIAKLIASNPFWFQAGSMLKMMNPSLVDKSIVKEYMDHIASINPVLLANLVKSLQEHNAEADLKEIKVPTLIFAAEDDTFTPVWLSRKKHHLIPQSELMVIKKGSHVALIEQPELINLRIEKFLKEHQLFTTNKIIKSKTQPTTTLKKTR